MLTSVALVGCSSSGGPAEGGDGGGPAASAGSVAGTGGGGAVPGGSVTTVVAATPEAMFEYYQKLGVAEPVIDCYLGALDELGVTSLQQLEDDQALGATAAQRFDRCVTEAGDGASAPPTT